MDKVFFIVYGTRSNIEGIDGTGAFTTLQEAQKELNARGYQGEGFANYTHSINGSAFIMSLSILSV